jgi:ketosteroid isomerase-like protein
MTRSILAALTFAALAMLPALAANEQPASEQILAEARAKIAAAAASARAGAKSAEESAIVAADLAFAADAKKRGAAEAFAAVMHPDGKMFPPRQPISVGVEAARAAFKDDKSLWEWAPVQVAASGDVGATWGIAAISGTGDDGKPFAITTRYVSVWRKDSTGTWKIWLDVGTPGPLPDMK